MEVIKSNIQSHPTTDDHNYNVHIAATHPCLKHHQVFDKMVLPGANYIHLITDIVINHMHFDQSVLIEDCVWIAPVICIGDAINLQIRLTNQRTFYSFKFFHKEVLVFSGRLKDSAFKHSVENVALTNLKLLNDKNKVQISKQELYTYFESINIHYGSYFQVISDTRVLDNHAVSCLNTVNQNDDLTSLIDGAFQTSMAISFKQQQHCLMPFSIGTIAIAKNISRCKNKYITLTRMDSVYRSSICILDINFNPIIIISDLGVKDTNQLRTETQSRSLKCL